MSDSSEVFLQDSSDPIEKRSVSETQKCAKPSKTADTGVQEKDHGGINTLQGKVDESERVDKISHLQLKVGSSSLSKQTDTKPRVSGSGLPPHLKDGLEQLSGYAMDDVKVHYNSTEPAQFHADAMAKGADIFLGPGQEKHLSHEAWHVVQQKQNRVNASFQFKGLSLNDNETLEKEATLMGVRAERVRGEQGEKSLIQAKADGPLQLGKKEVIAFIMGTLALGLEEALVFYEYLSDNYRLPVIVGAVALYWLEPWLQRTWQGVKKRLAGRIGGGQQAGDVPRVTRTLDGGGLVPNITPELERAHVQDIRGDAYLQEGEGHILANRYDVTAAVFNDTGREVAPGVTLIQSNLAYGNGATSGMLLFVNQNHYITLVRDARGIYEDQHGTRYNTGIKTVANGDCLIDGLYIIANDLNASPEQIQTARNYIADNIPQGTVQNTLNGIITGMIAGEHQPGIGTNVAAMIRQDTELWEPYLLELRERRKKAESETSETKGQESDGASSGDVGAFNFKTSYAEVSDEEFRRDWNAAVRSKNKTIVDHHNKRSRVKTEQQFDDWFEQAESLIASRKGSKSKPRRKKQSSPSKVAIPAPSKSSPAPDPSYTVSGIFMQRGPYAGAIEFTVYAGKAYPGKKGGAEPLIIIPMNGGVEIHVHFPPPSMQSGDYTAASWINIDGPSGRLYSGAGGVIGADLLRLLNGKSGWSNRKAWELTCAAENQAYKGRKKRRDEDGR